MRLDVATPADRAEVERLLSASYPVLLAGAYPPEVLDRAMPVLVTAQERLLGSGTYYILRDPGAAAAGGWTREAPGTGAVTDGLGHVRHVVVDAARTGEGLGRALVEHIAAEAGAAGMTALDCLSTLNARAFYAACGFREIGPVEVRLGGKIPFPSVRMIREM